MPIYEYECFFCKHKFEKIEKVSSDHWNKDRNKPIVCESCFKKTALKVVSRFKIGTGVLETTGKSGYQTDALTLGKIIDNKGIPYEYKASLRKREERINRVKKFTKDLKERGKKYGFDPFSSD